MKLRKLQAYQVYNCETAIIVYLRLSRLSPARVGQLISLRGTRLSVCIEMLIVFMARVYGACQRLLAARGLLWKSEIVYLPGKYTGILA